MGKNGLHYFSDCGTIALSINAKRRWCSSTAAAASNQRKRTLSMTSPIVPQFKVCTQCGETFPATTEFFYKHYDGLLPSCKVCGKAYTARYNAQHKEEQRAYRAKHADEYRARAARYRAENPEAIKTKIQRRLARKQSLPNTLTAAEWQRCLDYFGNKCAYCGKTKDMWTILSMEHWIALKDPREDNPGTVATNIVPACHARKGVPAGQPCCNNNKGNKDPEVWLVEKFGTRKARKILKRIQAYFEWVKEQSE